MSLRTTCLTSLFFTTLFLAAQSHAADVTELSSAPQEVIDRLIGEILPGTPALARAFGIEGLDLVSSRESRNGRRVSRYVQTYRDIPVWGKQLVVSRSENGAISRLGGTLVGGIAADIGQTDPGIDRNVMVDSLRAEVAAGYVSGLPVFEREKGELVIYIDEDSNARLAYEVEFLADIDGGGEPSRPTFVVDANTGEVLKSYDALAHQAVAGDCSVECTLLDETNLSGSAGRGRKGGEWLYYSVEMPPEVAEGSTLTVSISGGSGDADLYTRLGANPTSNTYACRPYLTGSNESCSHTVKAFDVWHIGVSAYQNFSGVSLTASVKAPVVVEEFGQGPGGNEKVGLYYYDYDFPALTLGQSGSNCVMENPDVKTVDLNNGTSGSSAYVYDIWPDCYNDHDAVNGAFSPLNDAHFFGQVVFDMYNAWLGVPPLTFQLTMRVHYSTNYENAFWDGSSMTFGDGYTTFHPLVSLDVSAHEVSHGFTDQNSDLIYSDQSGGINEAFSDISGEAAEFFMTGEADFLVGADIFKGNGSLRYMADPPLDGVSIGHADDYTSGMDVHYSSGVFNKAFYLLANTSGWGVREAFEVFAWANQDYWTPSTNFQQGAEGVLQAAVDGAYNAGDVINAFQAVGISLSLPEPPAAPALVIGGVSYNSVDLSWDDVANEAGYRVLRDGNVLGEVSAGTTAYVDSTVAAETTYSYSIQAWNASGDATSASVDVTTPAEPPQATVTLEVETYATRKRAYADLTVTGTSLFDVYRDGSLRASGQSGVYSDNAGRLSGGLTRTYQVCVAGTTDQCSDSVTVTW
jgi:Zn-dependent metalloprotease